MRPIWTGAIGFGLVNIPVKLYSATESSAIDLDMLDKKDHNRIKYKRVNEKTGREVDWNNIVKGYKLKSNYVVLNDKDFEAASAKKTKLIEINAFVETEEIDSMYYEVPYYLVPEKSGVRPYALLREALKKTKMAGLGSFVMRNREHLVIIKVSGNAIILNRIRFEEEIRDPKELDIPGKITVKPAELKMAQLLIKQLTEKFSIKKYKDSYNDALLKIIRAKSKGKKTKVPEMKVVHSRSDDLMDQLKASLKSKKKKAS